MASKTTLNAKNLEALGAARLADLLIEISTGSAAAKRKLRFALAAAQSPKEASREIAKRLTSIARARSFVTWKKRKALVADLETQRRAIIEQIAPADPEEALSLMWRFMALATPVFDRCDDSSGAVIEIFHHACADLGQLATTAKADPARLADRVLDALHENGYGQYDHVIAVMAPALGDEGLSLLKSMVENLYRTPVPVPPETEWREVGWGPSGTTYEHELREDMRKRLVSSALVDIADAQGDVDGFAAQYDPETRKNPLIAAEIGTRLLAAGRAEEAFAVLEQAEFGHRDWRRQAWQECRLQALEALGRTEEAQAFRWTCFEQTLSKTYLKDYLKRLPDFDDIEAEERAMAHAASHPSLLGALQFFLEWPAVDQAALLLLARHDEIDGDYYEYLAPAAEVLSEHHPLATTLVLRAMIDFTLSRARSKRYRYSAEHLATCERLAPDIADFGAFETHGNYVEKLKTQHGRKQGFWSLTKA